MAGFTLTASGTKGTIKLTSTNGSASGGQAYMSLGTLYTLEIFAPAFGGCTLFNVTSITAQWAAGKGQFLRWADHDTGLILTETTYDHSITDTPGTTYNLSSQMVHDINVGFFLGIPTVSYGQSSSISDTINVTANYDNGQQDTVGFVVNMQIPTMAMNMVFPTTASEKFDFGPFKDTHISGPTVVVDNVRVAWNDANYLARTPDTQAYSLGGTACGVPWPMQWSGTGNNTTSCDGAFYFVQLVSGSDDKTGTFFVWKYIFTTLANSSDYSPGSPYGLDSLRSSMGPSPYYWTWDVYTNAPSGSGSLPVPPTNSNTDLNGNPISYYGDCPRLIVPDVTHTPWFVFEMHDTSNFQSNFVFQPNGGIPIIMKGFAWGISLSEDNATVFSSLLWKDAFTVPGNWTGSATYTSPISYDGPAYLKWNYVYDDLSTKTKKSSSYIKFFDRIAANGPNVGPMGGAVAMDGNGGLPGLPRALAGNVSTMNTVI
jgi:hypothetical protein